jgi:hypothetical protein
MIGAKERLVLEGNKFKGTFEGEKYEIWGHDGPYEYSSWAWQGKATIEKGKEKYDFLFYTRKYSPDSVFIARMYYLDHIAGTLIYPIAYKMTEEDLKKCLIIEPKNIIDETLEDIVKLIGEKQKPLIFIGRDRENEVY